MKKVLLISQTYPPHGWTSSRRSGNMAKYLKDYGWQPIVLCQKWTPDNCVYDPTMVMNIPKDIVVYAADVKKTSRWSSGYVDDVIHRVLFPHITPTNFYRTAKILIPSILEKHKIDAVWSSAPQACNHSLAASIVKKYKLPWVADFRDVHQFKGSTISNLIRLLRIFYEKRLMRSASDITAVSELFAATLVKRHHRDVKIVYNGYDPDILTPEGTKAIKKFNILYTGGVNLGCPTFRPLLDACGVLIESGQIDRKDVIIQFFGGGNEVSLRKMFKDHEYLHLVEMNGQIHRDECLERQRNAAILLQATYPGTGTLTSKIYEYLATRRPILAIPKDENGIDRLLKETNSGISLTSVEDIAEQLLKWYQEWEKTGTILCHGKEDEITKYSRKKQAGQLARILEELTNG